MSCDPERVAQIPWDDDEFDHATARELFGSNLLALTWIKGKPMPRELVDEILRGLGLERESRHGRSERRLFMMSPSTRGLGRVGEGSSAGSGSFIG